MVKMITENKNDRINQQDICNPILEIIHGKKDTWILYEYIYKPPRSINKGIKIESFQGNSYF